MINYNFKIKSSSPQETMNIAQKLAKFLNKGDVVILTGELGAGKTKFVEGFLSYFGMENEISSPTFNIVNEYETPLVNIYHFDVYRLENYDEFYAIGGEEYFEKGICLMEWGETMIDVLPEQYIQISFNKDFLDENKRVLEFDFHGKEIILSQFKEELI